jgi:hypothetical protein
MTGLVAVISKDRSSAIPDREIAALADTYELFHEGGQRHTAAAGNHARVVKFDTSTAERRGIERSDASWAAATGVVYAEQSLVEAPLESLDGQFALISHHSERDEVVVATDPFAFHALFVAERDDVTYVSTSALTLARHLRPPPCELGQRMFLRTGYQLGPVTHWEGIELLEPGCCLIFSPRGCSRRIYWRPSVDEDIARLGFKAAVDHSIGIATETYRSYLGGRPGMWTDLSGGFDTRFLNLILSRAGIDFVTNTVGYDRDEDVRLAAEVCRRAEWDWVQITLPGHWPKLLPMILPLSLSWSDGRLELLQLAEVLWGHGIKSRSRSSLLLGGGHEHFRGHTWQQEFLKAGKSTNVNFDNLLDMRWMSRPVETSIFADDPTAEVRAELLAQARAWVEPFSSELNTTQLDLLHAYKMVSHFGAYGTAGGCFLKVEVPAYFKPIYTTAISINYRHRTNHQLMRHMFRLLDPAVAAVQTTAGGPAEPWRVSNLHRFVPYYAEIGRRAIVKLSTRAFGRPLLMPQPRLDPRSADARVRVLDDLKLKHAEMLSGGLYNFRRFDEFLARARDPGFPHGTLVARIITLELALRATTPGGHTARPATAVLDDVRSLLPG